jgi:hypothetical protein
MSTKNHVRELLSVYLDQMCSVEEKKTVEAHVAECAECRRELEDLRKTITLIAGLKEIEPPENMWEGIAQRIRKKSFWEIFVWSRLSGVAVATVTILLVAVTVNKYTTRVVEQAKTGTMHDVTAGSNMPLVPPLLSPKPVQSLEKKVAAKAGARPAPAVDAMRYNEEVVGKKDESDYAGAPQDTRSPSSYVIEMEVEDMEKTRQRLQALAESYQARRVGQFGDDRNLFYHVQQQQLSAFIREVNKLGRAPHRKIETESLWEAPAVNTLDLGSTTEPQLIRIKFNPSK